MTPDWLKEIEAHLKLKAENHLAAESQRQDALRLLSALKLAREILEELNEDFNRTVAKDYSPPGDISVIIRGESLIKAREILEKIKRGEG